MTLMEVLTLGGYAYTTAFCGWLYTQIRDVGKNHIRHLEKRVKALEDAAGR